MTETEEIKRHLQAKLTPKRYYHSLCVQKRAMRLGLLYGVDWYKAGIAGLVHDVCHCEKPQTLLRYLKLHGEQPDLLTLQHPKLWHAMAGAIYIREEFGIRDREIREAVRYHTTGRAGMSAFEQAVFLADLTSEDRNYPDAAYVRKLAEHSPVLAMRQAYLFTVGMLLREQKSIVKDCFAGYNEYIHATGQEE